MKATTYTMYCLEHGQSIRIIVANFYGFSKAQMQILRNAGCTWDQNIGWSFKASSVAEYNKVAKQLKGFNFGGFVAA